MGFWPNFSGPLASWRSPEDLGVVLRFIEAIDALERVKLCGANDNNECAQIEPSLLRKQGASLKCLHAGLEAWGAKDLKELREQAPGLRELDVMLEMFQEKKPRMFWTLLQGTRQNPHERSCWPAKVHRALSSFAKLRRLTLRPPEIRLVPVRTRRSAWCAVRY